MYDYYKTFKATSDSLSIPSYEEFYENLHKSSPFYKQKADERKDPEQFPGEAIQQCILKKDLVFMAMAGDQVNKALHKRILVWPVKVVYEENATPLVQTKINPDPRKGFIFRALAEAKYKKGDLVDPVYELAVTFDENTTDMVILMKIFLHRKMGVGNEMYIGNVARIHTSWLEVVEARLQAAFNWPVKFYYQIFSQAGKELYKNYSDSNIDALFAISSKG